MRMMALGLIPVLICLGMCFSGAILAFFGLHHVTDRTRDRSWDADPERTDSYTSV